MIARRIAGVAAAVLAALILAGCATKPPASPAAQGCPETKPCPACPVCPGVPPEKPKVSTLAPVAFADLPGWGQDDLVAAWPAFRASCRALRFRDAWREACARAEALDDPDGAAIRAYFETHFVPYRVANGDGATQGLVTGYYEPVLRGSRERSAPLPLPALRAARGPADHRPRVGRARHCKTCGCAGGSTGGAWCPIARAPKSSDGKAPVGGKELVYVDDAIEAFFLQIQGSGRGAARERRGAAHRLRGPERASVPVDRPLARRQGRARARAGESCRASRRGRARIRRGSSSC